jgi:hypothetical protein
VTIEEYSSALKTAPPGGLRVKGAWGFGTIKSLVVPGTGRSDWYVSVKWDVGTYSNYQRLNALTLELEADRYAGIVIAECPECEEPDSIFYSGDYICAWCREKLEE